jgi:hypothetical protein
VAAWPSVWVMYPPDFACTRARFVCLYFVRLGEYFEIFWQGFSEFVLQIPLETTIFRGAYPAGGGEAAWFELFCNLHNGYVSLKTPSRPGSASVPC